MVEIVLPRAVGAQGPAGPMGPGATDQQVASVVTPIVDAKTAGKAAKDGSNVEADAFRGAIGVEKATTPKFFGAIGDGVADDTQAIRDWVAYHQANGLAELRCDPGKVYLIDGIVTPAGATLHGGGATFKRRVNLPSPVCEVGAGGRVVNLIVDGSLDTLGASGASNRTTGLALNDYATAEECEVFQSYRHGITNMPVSVQREYYGCAAVRCYAHNNGINFNAAGSGSADGIAFTNVHNGLIRECRADTNSRSAFTFTTYDPETTLTDAALSTGCVIDGCDVGPGHGYVGAEVNMEAVSKGAITRLRGNAGITFRKSPHMLIDACAGGGASGAGADFATVNNCDFVATVRSHERIYLTGASPTVSNVRITCAAVTVGYTVSVLASDGLGAIHNVHVDGGDKAFRINVSNYSGLSYENNAGSGITDGPAGSPVVLTSAHAPSKTSGRRLCYLDGVPTTGTWAVGDTVYRRIPNLVGSPMGWVCTVAGLPGTWMPLAVTGLARAAAINNYNGADLAELRDRFNELLTKLRAANLVAS